MVQKGVFIVNVLKIKYDSVHKKNDIYKNDNNIQKRN